MSIFSNFKKGLKIDVNDPVPKLDPKPLANNNWRVIYIDNQWFIEDRFNDTSFYTAIEEYEYTGTAFSNAMIKAVEFRTGNPIINNIVQYNPKNLNHKDCFKPTIYYANNDWHLGYYCKKCINFKSFELNLHSIKAESLAKAFASIKYHYQEQYCLECIEKIKSYNY